MIFDELENLEKYSCVPKIGQIAKYLKETDVFKLETGDKEIEGRDLYVKALKYFPKKAEENKFEIHKKYADVQIMFKGTEKMQTTNRQNLIKLKGYDEKRELEFFDAEKDISDIVIRAGEFIIFLPQDVHKPGCLYQASDEPVLKLVFKIKMED
jgi:YhcH/YjgK/YiaL family protein